MPSPYAVALAIVLIAAESKPLVDVSSGPQGSTPSAKVYKFEIKGADLSLGGGPRGGMNLSIQQAIFS